MTGRRLMIWILIAFAALMCAVAMAGYWQDDYPAAAAYSSPAAAKYGVHLTANNYGRGAPDAGFSCLTNSVYSIAFWFRFAAAGDGLFAQWNATPNRGFYARVFNSKLLLQEYNGGYVLTYSPAAIADNGSWHFGCIVKDGATNRVWVNTLATTNTSAPFRYMHGGQFQLGGSPIQNIYWRGGLDEFAIWDRALSDAEVRTLYNGSNGMAYSASTAPYDYGCVAAWRLDEGTGTNTADSAASSNLTWGSSGLVWTNGYVQ